MNTVIKNNGDKKFVEKLYYHILDILNVIFISMSIR